MKNKAFTFVEIMIVVVIIGLLAAMAIPAFQKVKINTIAKAVASGQTVTESQMEYLREHRNQIPTDLLNLIDLDRGTAVRVEKVYVAPQTIRFDRTIVLDGKTYGLVPINN